MIPVSGRFAKFMMNPPATWRRLRQWLETDGAFGVKEVPLAAAVAAALRTGTVRSPLAAPVVASAPGLIGREEIRPPEPVVSYQSASPSPGAGIRTIIPAATALPPIPPGDIAALESLPPQDQTARLEQLQRQAEAELSLYLSDIATKVVFGEGDANAALMFIGEGPGAEEDRTGRPFVGRSGQLLDKMIGAMGLQRKQVYIGNIVKLRAAEHDLETGRPKDRPPTLAEVALNIPWLHRQIEIIRPKVIVTLGLPAIRHLVGETENMSRLRGQWRVYRGIPVMPTYHPSFLLRAYTPENRGKVWSDLKNVMAKLGLPG